ncbi:MAG TPA: hypothetical protein VIW68_10285 [Candidatus Sulfotelmatobacter sp.]
MLTLRLRSIPSGFSHSLAIGRIPSLVLLAVLGSSFLGTAVCQGQDLTPNEKQGVRQIAQGTPGEFVREPAVSGTFLEKLLSGGFKSADQAHNMEVHGIVITNAVFHEEVDINFEVPYRVVFKNCQFQKGLDFSGSQFDKDLLFDSSTFGTTTSYTQANSSDDSDGVLFINATVKGTLSIESADFHLPADFTKAHVKELDIENAIFESNDQGDPDLDLSAVSVESDLALSVKSTQPRTVDAQLLNVGRLANFGRLGTPFFATKELYLADAHFQKLTIYEFGQWQAKQQKGALSLDGFSFQVINYPCADHHCGAWQMLALLDSPQFSYSPQPYLALEQNLSSTGNPDDADNVYIHMRERQRGRRMNLAARAADWVLDWLIGYGREPGRAVWWTLGFVGLGMLIFSPRHMVSQGGDGEKTDPGTKQSAAYSRFWYSLDVLAPAIELGADKAWQPRPDWWFGRNYSYVHRILGWILVPLILAALTGVIH